jgi:hypothetical protein
VCEGRVGAVFALEASRLARNSRDWHHLIDLCGLTGTVVVDYDGVYDPRLLNDRLLLGLKGAMSEFELGLIHQRAQEALRAMIRRGVVLTEVPVGYVRTDDNRCEMTPDLQVQAAINGVFSKFSELGTARQVLLWYLQEEISLPVVRRRTRGRSVLWRQASYDRILSVLKNPTYAGTFVYGRHKTRTKVVDGRARKALGPLLPPEEWEVVLHDHHPGYISWEQYLENREQLRNNTWDPMTMGAARKGEALLYGLLRCGQCGMKLQVTYKTGTDIFRYCCKGREAERGSRRCISFAGRKVDGAIATQVIEALEPAGVQAALDVWDQIVRQEDEKRRQLRLASQKARYEADRARRQYDAVEPENRLVAAELERRWNEELHRLDEIEMRLSEASATEQVPSEGDRERLLELGQDLEVLWRHPDASSDLRKRIIRTVLKEIVADVTDVPPEVVLRLHWEGGIHTLLKVRKNRSGHNRYCTDRKVVDLVRELIHICGDGHIASVLNRLGYRTGTNKTWTKSRVTSLRSGHRIPKFDSTASRSWLTQGQAAKALGVSANFVRRLLRDNILPGRQVVPHAPWVIEASNLELPQVQAAVAALRAGRRSPSKPTGQDEFLLFSTT